MIFHNPRSSIQRSKFKRRKHLTAEQLEARQLLTCAAPDASGVRRQVQESSTDPVRDLHDCVNQTFEFDGDDYEVTTYYTNNAGQTHQITDALANQLTADAAQGFEFYLEQGFPVLPGSKKELTVYVGTRGGNGSIVTSSSNSTTPAAWSGWTDADSLIIDAPSITGANALFTRKLAFHETFHIVEARFDSSPDLTSSGRALYAEGAARAIEDRIELGLDQYEWQTNEGDGRCRFGRRKHPSPGSTYRLHQD